MNTLLPIIRRVRRPLIVRDAPPVLVGNVEPVRVELGNIQQPTTNIEHPMGEMLVNEVSGGPPETTGGSPVLPESKRDAKAANKRSAR